MAPGFTGSGWKRRGTALAVVSVALVLVALVSGAALRPTVDARAALLAGDYRAAHDALLQAAEGGDAAAQTSLGNLYYLGLGVETDYRQSIAWYWKAASQGHVPAQMNLGHIYAQGLGVPLDPIRAFGWYRQAELGGSEKAKATMRLIAGSMQMTPNQIQRAQNDYGTLEALRP